MVQAYVIIDYQQFIAPLLPNSKNNNFNTTELRSEVPQKVFKKKVYQSISKYIKSVSNASEDNGVSGVFCN